ncbi:MAG TPA: hypothetical protein VNS88_13215 [Nitrospiraceae bacterium]|nr:hypothetical protein [Nitrospiraceae bacterium]
MEIDKDAYVRSAEQMVETEGFTPSDIGNLLAFVQSTAGKKLVGTMSIEAKNSIMQMGNIDFHAPNAPMDAQALRAGALALNTFIDTVFGLVEEPEPEEKEA